MYDKVGWFHHLYYGLAIVVGEYHHSTAASLEIVVENLKQDA